MSERNRQTREQVPAVVAPSPVVKFTSISQKAFRCLMCNYIRKGQRIRLRSSLAPRASGTFLRRHMLLLALDFFDQI